MNNHRLAEAYLQKARRRLVFVEGLREERAWDDVVRLAQEAVELALKALLRFAGIDPPKAHDVAGALRRSCDRLPDPAQRRAEELAVLSEELAGLRGPAFYGDEGSGTPPTALFSREQAEAIATRAHEAVALVAQCIEER